MKSLQQKYERALRKRDKWAARADALAQTLKIVPPGALGAPPRLPAADLKQFLRGGKYHGVFASVARQLGVIPYSVRKCAHGHLRSVRISAALAAEMRRVDCLPADEPLVPLTQDEKRQFQHGGRYFGLQVQVARSLGLGKTSVSMAACHPEQYRPTFTALREAMAVVDAALGSRSGGAR